MSSEKAKEYLKQFIAETIYPACSSSNSAIKLTLEQLETITKYEKWVDVCKYL